MLAFKAARSTRTCTTCSLSACTSSRPDFGARPRAAPSRTQRRWRRGHRPWRRARPRPRARRPRAAKRLLIAEATCCGTCEAAASSASRLRAGSNSSGRGPVASMSGISNCGGSNSAAPGSAPRGPSMRCSALTILRRPRSREILVATSILGGSTLASAIFGVSAVCASSTAPALAGSVRLVLDALVLTHGRSPMRGDWPNRGYQRGYDLVTICAARPAASPRKAGHTPR